MRAYRNHRGVRIYRIKELITGSDWDVKDNGIIVDRKPEYDVYFKYADGPKCDTVEECKTDIDEMLSSAERFNGVVEMVAELNTGSV